MPCCLFKPSPLIEILSRLFDYFHAPDLHMHNIKYRLKMMNMKISLCNMENYNLHHALVKWICPLPLSDINQSLVGAMSRVGIPLPSGKSSWSQKFNPFLDIELIDLNEHYLISYVYGFQEIWTELLQQKETTYLFRFVPDEEHIIFNSSDVLWDSRSSVLQMSVDLFHVKSWWVLFQPFHLTGAPRRCLSSHQWVPQWAKFPNAWPPSEPNRKVPTYKDEDDGGGEADQQGGNRFDIHPFTSQGFK